MPVVVAAAPIEPAARQQRVVWVGVVQGLAARLFRRREQRAPMDSVAVVVAATQRAQVVPAVLVWW